jgi:hypothetical protein
MNCISKLYYLSGILSDDLWLVSHVIRSYSPNEINFSKILKSVEALKVDEYEVAMDNAIDSGIKSIVEASKGIVFINEANYVVYLQGILRINGIPFAPFTRVAEIENRNQKGLF